MLGKDARTAAVWVLQGVTGAEQIHSPLLRDAQGCRRKSPKADGFLWGWGNSEQAVNQSQDANNGLPLSRCPGPATGTPWGES